MKQVFKSIKQKPFLILKFVDYSSRFFIASNHPKKQVTTFNYFLAHMHLKINCF